MASSACYDLIRSEIASAAAPLALVDWEQVEPQEQQGAATWLALEQDYASEDQATVGCPETALIAEEGALTIHIFTRSGQSLSAARALADNLRAALRGKRLASGVQIGDVDPPAYGLLNAGRWSSLELTLLFTRYSRELLA